jgi:hypothetical protein
MRTRLNPALPPELLQKPVVGVLLPLPLAGAYDYKLPPGVMCGARRWFAAPWEPRCWARSGARPKARSATTG